MKLLNSIVPLVKIAVSRLNNPVALLRLGHVGKRYYIGKGLQVHAPGSIYIGNKVTIGRYSRLSAYNTGKDKTCHLDSTANDEDFSGYKIVIHDGCYICNLFSILAGAKVVVGENTLIASYVTIMSENHSIDPECGMLYGSQSLKGTPTEIGHSCWIGEKATIMPGVTIGPWSIIGAASVVTSDIPPYSIAVGNPAKVIKRYNFRTHEWEKQ